MYTLCVIIFDPLNKFRVSKLSRHIIVHLYIACGDKITYVHYNILTSNLTFTFSRIMYEK